MLRMISHWRDEMTGMIQQQAYSVYLKEIWKEGGEIMLNRSVGFIKKFR